MHLEFRTARLRRVAVLTVLGLAAAGAVAEWASGAAIALVVLVCGALFWLLSRSTSSAETSQALVESLIESSPDGVIAFDTEGRYTVWNRAIEELLDIPRNEVIGKTPAETPLTLGEEAFAARRAALRGEVAEVRNEVRIAPGREDRVYDVVYGPLRNARGEIIGAVGHVRDVTKGNLREQQLRQSHKLEAIGQLAGGIAHDFNNVLMGIGAHASAALAIAPEELEHDLEGIRQAVARGAALTEQLLFFAQRRERPFERVELNPLVLDVVEELQQTFDDSIAIELDFRDPSWVSGDAGQLAQVAHNLITNARDAMPRGGKLRIQTRPSGADHVQLIVEDTGNGIPDDIKAHIFEPFFTTKEVGSGTGLGLASAYGIVTQCGGSIDVSSIAGHGARFTVTLPKPRPDEGATRSKVEDDSAPGRGTILFVEDDSVVRGVIRDGLEQQGHDVVTAAGPMEALAYSKDGGRFDVLVTDVVMPELGGGELAEELRRAGHPFSTIYISGYPASGITLDERSVFLQKPFELDELYAVVRSHLR